MKLHFENLPRELKFGLEKAAPYLTFELSEEPGAVSVSVGSCDEGFRVSAIGDTLQLLYAETCGFFRALTFLPRVWETRRTVKQKREADTLAYMADVSRNGVLNESGFQKLVVHLALLGYNSVMLYTEETYEVPGEPYFGYHRGRYSLAEIRAMDDFAYRFGIELIPCIQTLAHLASALRWPCFLPVSDTEDILLVGEEKTYELIEKMIAGLSGAVRSRRIHIGMDEAHRLGLGRYLDKNGYQNRFDILSRHLVRVRDICRKYGRTPLMWSDMFFRLYNHGCYELRADQRLPKEILDKIPEGVSLVYWDYYNTDPEQLDAMMESHLASGNETWLAGGAVKWVGMAPFNRISMIGSKEEIRACRRHRIRHVLLTAWGDDGAEASPFSVWPTVAYYAESFYNEALTPKEQSRRFEEVFGISLDAFMKLDLPNEIFPETNERCYNPSKYLLYNQVLGGLMDAHVPDNAPERYVALAGELRKEETHPVWGILFRAEAALCDVLALKTKIALTLRPAYRAQDTAVLRRLAGETLPELKEKVRLLQAVLQKQWLQEQKSFGWDILLERFSAMAGTCDYAAERITDYLEGRIPCVEELEEPLLPYQTDETGKPSMRLGVNRYEEIFSASKFKP